WSVRVKKRVRGIDPDEDPSYPAIGRSIKHIDDLASAQGWQLLSSFLSEDPDVALDLLDDEEEEVDAVIKKLGKLQWFKPKDALGTVQKLVDAIEQLPARLPLQPKNRARVLAELKELRRTLQLVDDAGAQFRFYAEFG